MSDDTLAAYSSVPRWWTETGEKRADAVAALVADLIGSNAMWEGRALSAVCLYEGRQMPSLHPLAYYRSAGYAGDNYDQLTWNIPRSLCQTVQAKIAGINRTKVNFIVTEGDWTTKRRAKRLDRFVEAQLYARQGVYPDAWQLMQRVCLDALIMPGGGFCKVTANYEEKNVQLERVFSWELFVDPDDARHGAPRTLIHRFAADADAILERFPEAENALFMAKRAEDPAQDMRASTRAVKQVWVYEAWRLGSPKKPGVHVLCIDGFELFEEEWAETRFPFVRLQWSQETIGWGAQSLVEEVAVVNDELNHTLQRMQEGERKLANGVLIVPKGSVSPELLESNEIGKIIEVEPNAGFQPVYEAPPGFSGTTLQWLQLNRDAMFELPGVSQMAATSRKEPGIEAAVAIRTMQDVQTERFAIFESAYEAAFVELARLIVAATRKLAEDTGGDEEISVRWFGKNFLRNFNWSECDLDEDQYTIRPDPVSGVKNTTADRLQLATDLMQSGVIAPDAFARVIQYLDTPGEFQRVNKQREWVESQIEEWLDASPDSGFVFHPPIKFMVLEDALLQVVEAYFSALVDGAPDYNLSFFLQWMEYCDSELQERAARAAALQAANQPAPPPAPMAAAPGVPPAGALNAA